ncbi:hypothetical protein [Vagococcus bubulae]|uniref:Membrane protein 6-pyruvoyl-tetrahydropterin synthase-related domain-containing protein n=1 Tax=Vagococcus bubulae TaxID=1977868 RepID=A0A429ZR73_9ENTE|nr:hypothetical protein [Vagococcus bubulae]RST96187.1 hypothetical protein CBF36_00195 [Vagococcus bubulae]
MKKERFFILFLWIGLSLLYMLPIVDLTGWHVALIRGDDYPFHFARIFGVMDQLKDTGHTQAIAKFGEHDIFYGANIFYPTLTTVLPIALLSFVFQSVIGGVYGYLFLMNLLTFYIAYKCAKYISNIALSQINMRAKQYLPFIFSFFYVFSHYRMICFYQRFDLGEFFVLTMYPLVFAGFYSILKDNGTKKYWLIGGLALISYSHILSLMLAVVVLAVLFVVSLIKKMITTQVFKQLVFSAVMTVLLSFGALAPIIYEMFTLHIRSVRIHDLASEAANVGVMLASSSVNYLSYMSIGIVLLFTLIIGVYQVIWKKESFVRKNKLLRLCLWVSLVITLMMTSVFPWHLLQQTPLSIIQFPFRLMPFLSVFGSFLGAAILADSLSQVTTLSRKRVILGLSVGILIMSTLSVNSLMIRRSLNKLMYSKQDIVTTRRYERSVNKDYFPAGLTDEQTKRIKDKIGQVNQEEVPMPYQFKRHAAIIELTLTDPTNTVITPIIGYSGIVVEDEHGRRIKTTLSSERTLSFQLPKGDYQLSIYYDPPFLIKYSMVFSGILALFYSVYVVKIQKRDLPQP